MKYLGGVIIMSSLLLTKFLAGSEGVTSEVWKNFKELRSAGSVPNVADFSYVGYHTGVAKLPEADWKVFDVTDYGAVPDDGKSDKLAIIAAIEAAEANGSGIIHFPKGRFRLNDESDPHNEPIKIRSSNIVLRGSGSGDDGTELFFERHMDPADPKKMWTCPYALQFRGKGLTDVKSVVVKDSLQESFAIEIEHPEKFEVGDWVLLSHKDNSKEAVAKAIAPYEVDDRWTAIIENGVEIRKMHRIKSIDDQAITFWEPIHAEIKADKGWTIQKVEMLEEIGIQDLAFVGNWQDEFVHHKNAIHDGGWSAISLSYCANSWVRDCRFTDWNRVLEALQSAGLTIQDLLIDGTPGHNAISLLWTYHTLVQRIDDQSSHWHASGVAKTSSGNVFLRSEYSSETCYESHAAQPRWTLLDNISGGWKYGRWGGALFDQPNHLEGLIHWNYRNTGSGEPGEFRFMRDDSDYGRIIMPYVIGFHGNPQEWAEEQIKVLESNGRPVYPESLYEAQLELRMNLKAKDACHE